MKKQILLFILLSLSNIVFAQTNFLNLINSIDWDTTESDIVKKLNTNIQPRSHHYNNQNKTTTDYKIVGIILGDKECTASIFVDSITRKVHSLDFDLTLNTKLEAAQLSEEMDKILYPLFGEPDRISNDLGGYVKHMDRIWYQDNYIIDANHMFVSKSQSYSLTVKGIPNKANDFRVAKWGESKSSIMQKEGEADRSGLDELYLFPDHVAGIDCQVAYIFTNDKLTMAKYLFKPIHTNKNDFIKDYEELVELMTQKYGKPDYDTPEWYNSLYKNNYDEYGFAISLGHLSFNAGWRNDITGITVALYGENYKISLMIQYISKKYDALKEKIDTQEKIKNL